MMKPQKPHVTQDLLRWLEHAFPDRAPNRDLPDRHVWIQVGHAEVLRHLQAIYRDQEHP